MKAPSPYLLVAIRDRRTAARERFAHYRHQTSACAKADAEEAAGDVEFYTAVLACLDPKERWQ